MGSAASIQAQDPNADPEVVKELVQEYDKIMSEENHAPEEDVVQTLKAKYTRKVKPSVKEGEAGAGAAVEPAKDQQAHPTEAAIAPLATEATTAPEQKEGEDKAAATTAAASPNKKEMTRKSSSGVSSGMTPSAVSGKRYTYDTESSSKKLINATNDVQEKERSALDRSDSRASASSIKKLPSKDLDSSRGRQGSKDTLVSGNESARRFTKESSRDLLNQRRSSVLKKENTDPPADAQSEASIALFRSLLARLSGKAPQSSSDFSNLEDLNLSQSEGGPDMTVPKKVEEARKIAREDMPVVTKHRRQSYFRTGGIRREKYQFGVHRRQSSTGRRDSLPQEEQTDKADDKADGEGQNDTWDSVSGEAACTVCSMVFQHPWQLERHTKFSTLHARNVEKIKAKEKGIEPPPVATYYEMKLHWEYRLIYSGSKFFWRTQAVVDLNMYLYEAEGAEPFILIMFYDPKADKDLPPLFVSHKKVNSSLNEEELQQKASEQMKSLNPEHKLMESMDTIMAELRRQAIVTFILARIVQKEPHTHLHLDLVKLSTDTYDSIKVDKLPFLQTQPDALSSSRRRRSSFQDMEDKLSQAQNDAEIAQDKIMRASGHLDEVRQTLAEIDQMNAVHPHDVSRRSDASHAVASDASHARRSSRASVDGRRHSTKTHHTNEEVSNRKSSAATMTVPVH